MINRALLRLVAAALAVPVATLSSQPTLPAGTRVRLVQQKPPTPLVGTVISWDHSTVRLTSDAGRVIGVQRVDLTSVAVSAGRSDRRVAGMLAGGLLSGAAFVGSVCAFSDGSCAIDGHLGGFLAYYAVGAIPGVFVGRAVGKRVRGPERWRELWSAGVASHPISP